jgi:hypothetical protein
MQYVDFEREWVKIDYFFTTLRNKMLKWKNCFWARKAYISILTPKHVACQNHTHLCKNHTYDCSNHKQSAKIIPRVPKSYAGCQQHTHDVKITLVRVVKPLVRIQSGIYCNLTLILVGFC